MSDASKVMLLVEDDPNDVFFLKYAFEEAGIQNQVQVVDDGQKAIDYLSGTGPYADRRKYPFPCIVLLDLMLPIKLGMDVLRWIRAMPETHSLIVIMLTSSKEPKDVDEAYRLGARSFLVKPLSVTERVEVAKAIKHYWLDLNEFSSFGGASLRR